MACASQHKVTVRGVELHRQISTLRSNGVAEVEAERYTKGEDEAKTVSETVRFDQRVVLGKESYTIRELSEDCPAVLPFLEDKTSHRRCALVRLRSQAFDVRSYQTRSAMPIVRSVIGVGVLGAVVGAVACAYKCEDDGAPKLASQIVLGSAGVLFVGFVAWELTKCILGLPCGH